MHFRSMSDDQASSEAPVAAKDDVVEKACEDAGPSTDALEEEDVEDARRSREALLSDEDKERLKTEAQELKDKGNQEFGHGRFEEAEKIYTDALDIAPLCFTEVHAVLLSNRAAARTKQQKWQEVVADCDKAIAIGSPNEKPLERRANAYAHIEEELEKAIEDYRKLLELKPSHKPYLTAIQRVEKEIEERNERTKEKVMEQLKVGSKHVLEYKCSFRSSATCVLDHSALARTTSRWFPILKAGTAFR